MADKSKVPISRVEGLEEALAITRQGAVYVETSDFNTMDTQNLFSIVNSVKDVTQNAPQNVTATWVIMSIWATGNVMQIAYRLDNPANAFVRSRVNGTWTAWNYQYAAYLP